jgi:uncharacterized protein YbjT (DUF2867 family)
MRIAITAASGRVGRAVAGILLDEGIETVLVVRDGQRVRDLAVRGATVGAGSLEDPAFLAASTRGVDALFVVTPTDPAAEDLRRFQNRVGAAAAEAARANRIPRIVNLSSLGAHRGSGYGPVNGLHDVEDLLSDAAPNVTHLRPAYFFENFLSQIDTIRDAGGILLPVSGRARIPMVAGIDVAGVAARRLVDEGWRGSSAIGIHGPCDVTFQEVAAAFAAALDHPVIHIKVAEALARETLLRRGFSRNAAESILELYRAIDTGIFQAAERRTPETTTRTTLHEFVESALAPAGGGGAWALAGEPAA